jgi:hypothetical protein
MVVEVVYDNLRAFVGGVQQAYAQYHHHRNRGCGVFWAGRFKSRGAARSSGIRVPRYLHTRRTHGGVNMQNDPVVEEVRRIRHAYAKRFGFDLRAMVADLRRKEQEHPDRLVSFAPKPLRRLKTA